MSTRSSNFDLNDLNSKGPESMNNVAEQIAMNAETWPNNVKPMLVTMEHGTGMAATEVMMLAAYILPMAYELRRFTA